MPTAPGMPGQPRRWPGSGEPGGRRVPGQVSHPARTRSRASTGTRCAHQRRMRDGGRPGQRGTWPASPGGGWCRRHSRPSLRARCQATMTSMRPPRTRGGGRQPALSAGQQPARGALATGHGGRAARRPVSGKDCRRPGSTTAQTPDVAGPHRRRCPRLPTVSRLIGPERQIAPSRHRRRSRRPGAHSCR